MEKQKFIVSYRRVEERELEVVAANPHEAIETAKSVIHDSFEITSVENDEVAHVVVGTCEDTGKLILESDEYHSDSEGVMWLKNQQ